MDGRSQSLSAPAILFPQNQASFSNPGVDFSIPLQWQAVEGAQSYQLVIQIRPSGANPILLNPIVTEDTAYALTVEQAEIGFEATVSWSIVARSSAGVSPPSIAMFTIGLAGTPVAVETPSPTPLPAPTLLAPQNGAVFPEDQLNEPVPFSWTPVSGAASYQLTLLLNDEVFLRQTIQDTQFPVFMGNVPPINTVYQWTVRPISIQDDPGMSSPRKDFRIGGAGIFPTPTPVASGADLTGDGIVGREDLLLLSSRYQTNYSAHDLDQSGLVDALDLLILVGRYSSSP